LPDATPHLPDLEGQFAVMREAMPAVLQDRLLAEADGENRLLTILFSDLTGSVSATARLAPEDAAALVNDVLKLMIDAVLEHDGRISRLLGDGMLAFFGTPVARESDPERAILAAMRIREQVRRLGLNVTAGVNTGEVYLGTVGTEGHHEVTAMGTAINLAARLRESARPGEIVVGEATYHHTRRMFELTTRLVDAKGFGEPVPAFLVERRMERPEKVRGVEGLQAELIGRDEELQKLRLALEEVRLGRGQLVSIVGEAGVGKSRLVADLGQSALADPERAPRWLEGRCLDIGMAVSYWPFLDLFRACFGWRVEDDEAARGRLLVSTLRGLVEEDALGAARCRELIPLVADLLSVDLGSAWPVVSHVSAEQARQQTMLAIRDVVLALARGRGLVLIVDDLHWADPSSLDVVSLLMESITLAPLLMICAYRPDAEHRSWHLSTVAARKCADRYTEIRLRELTPHQSRRLIASLLRIEELPGHVGDLILEKAQGNPFFVEEVVRALIDAGEVFRDAAGNWRARPELGAVAVPESIQGVILSRVDRLRQETRRVLQSASVIGRVFRRRLLAHVTSQEADLDRALWELEERALIYEDRVTPEPEYSFQHQLTQETIYRSLLRRQRQAFHQQVAEAIEVLYAEGLDELYEQLAYHFDRAGETTKAVDYLVRAGQKASAQFANAEAITHFDRALELAGEGPREESIRALRAAVHLELFHGAEAAADYQWLLDRAVARGERAAELAALLGLGNALYLQGLDDRTGSFMAQWLAACERALGLARELGDRHGIVRALLMMVWKMDFWPETLEQAREHADEALRVARTLGDAGLLVQARIAALNRFAEAPVSKGVAEGEALAVELEARGDLAELNRLCFMLMLCYLWWGDFERGIETCDRAFDLAARLGIPPVQYVTIKAACLWMLGRYGEAWTWLQREVADEEHPLGRAFRELGEGVYFSELAAYERAVTTLRTVVEEAKRLNRTWMRDAADAWLGLASVRLGTVDDAWVREVWSRLDHYVVAVPTPIAGVEILLAQGDVEATLRRLDVLAEHAERLTLRPRSVLIAELRSRVLLRLGRAEEALAATESALPLAEAMEYRPMVWQLLAARAAALAALGRDDEAEADRRAALGIVRDLATTIEDEELRRGYLGRAEVAAIANE
jgi:class 3 adenylate cyclase/tetratricopeptide (TPR) repeat protein